MNNVISPNIQKNASFAPLGGNVAPGIRSLANAMLRFENLEQFRSLAPLPKDAQELIDDAVIKVGLDRLVIVADLMAEGLTYPLANWLSVPELYWEKSNRPGAARRTMVPNTRGENQREDRSGTRIPIYATLDEFSIGIRELRASERAGAPLDTSNIEQCTRNVNESFEDAMINGGITVGGNSSPGLLGAPSVNTQAYVDNEAWTAAGHNGLDILTDVLNMAQKLRTAKKYGPYNLYIPSAYGTEINKPYTDGTTTFDKTVREVLEQQVWGGRPLRIREADLLPANRTVLVQMTSDVLDVVVGEEPMPISWEHPSGFEFSHVVIGCIVPRVKDTYDGQSGICVGNTT